MDLLVAILVLISSDCGREQPLLLCLHLNVSFRACSGSFHATDSSRELEVDGLYGLVWEFQIRSGSKRSSQSGKASSQERATKTA